MERGDHGAPGAAPGVVVGIHISIYSSSAPLYEVGFNHFFRANRLDRLQRPYQAIDEGFVDGVSPIGMTRSTCRKSSRTVLASRMALVGKGCLAG
jgi:hypothetical protein